MAETACVGRKNGWPFCPWVLTGSLAKPYYFFEKDLAEQGSEAADVIGKELAKLMLLLDKLFITLKKEDGEELIPGYEAWLQKTADKWSPDDCFCSEDMRMAPFKEGEKDLLTQLWLKSRVLHKAEK